MQQTIFNTVRDHLLKQNAKSMREYVDEEQCAYRGKDGRMCSIGCLITDEHYRAEWEGKGASWREVVSMVERSLGILIDPEIGRLLIKLQNIHDVEEVEDWPEYLDEVADRFGLDR